MSRLREVLMSARFQRWAKWLVGLVVAFGLFGYFAAPPLLKSVLLSQLSKELNREVAIERIDINPYALSLKVAGVSVKTREGKEQAGFDELFVNLSSASFFKFAGVVDEIRLQGLRLAVARTGDGRYDISDLLDKWMQPKDEPDSGTPRFSLNNIQLIGGKIEFDDQPKNARHTISDINLSLPFVSSLPYQAEIVVQPAFAATIDGSALALKGRSKPFAQTHESELDLDLDRFDLTDIQPYLPDYLPFRLASGQLFSELKAVFKEVADGKFSLTVVGAAHVADLGVQERNGAPLVGWKRLDVDLDKIDPINREFVVKRVALDGLDAHLSVNRQGEMNVLRLLDQLAKAPKDDAAKSPDTKTEAAPALTWSLGEFALNDGILHWRDDSKNVPVNGEVRHIQVTVDAIDSAMAKPIKVANASYQIDLGERFRVEKMAFKDVLVDLAAHRIDIAEVHNEKTQARMSRNKDGEIEWVSSPVLKTVRATDAKVKDEKPWIGKVAKLSVDDLAFRFEDQTTQPAAVQQIDGFSLHGESLTNEPGKKGQIALKSRINGKGSLEVGGSLQIFPLDVALKVETVALPMMPLEPYFGQFLNIAVTRGQVSNKGEATVQIVDSKLKASYKGSATLGDFVAVDKLNSADFLKWKSLYFGNVDFRLDPMAINVGEIALSDFFSRLILNKDGRLNVADIVKKTEAKETPAPVKPDPKPAAPAEPAKATPPIKIARITLQNGTVNFSDFFVKPNYTVNLTKLGGKVNGLSSAADTVADMELRGSYANSAPVQIVGKLNPLAAQQYLDIKADITGVDLVGFSPYSGKYAGYAIEKGKLSMNLAYKLENRQLAADNRVFIDQFTFGDKVESPDATKLPVNLALSLLKNNRGEIDINLPIAGSLDDPEFSVGGLVIRVIVNLFVKAVTSPFALLGSMFGGGEELSNVDFAVGRANFSEAATKKLEAIAKALTERQSLKLEVTGLADPELDKEGVKRVAIERAMKAEKLKDLKKRGEGDSLEAIEIAPAEYAVYLTRAYREAKFPKPRNVVGLQKDLPVEEMEKLMLTNLPATDDDLRELARQRAENVQGWLVDKGKVAPERVFLLPAKVESSDKAKGNRVDFSLR